MLGRADWARVSRGSIRQNSAATASVAVPVSKNSPGMLTPTAISAIVAADEITIAAALTMLFAAIARARLLAFGHGLQQRVERHDEKPARGGDAEEVGENSPM